jgi:hypothetical protein
MVRLGRATGTEHGVGRRSKHEAARTLLELLLAAATLVLVVGELLLERAHEALGELVPGSLLVRGHAVPLLAEELGEVTGGQVGVVKGELGATDAHVDEVD